MFIKFSLGSRSYTDDVHNPSEGISGVRERGIGILSLNTNIFSQIRKGRLHRITLSLYSLIQKNKSLQD